MHATLTFLIRCNRFEIGMEYNHGYDDNEAGRRLDQDEIDKVKSPGVVFCSWSLHLSRMFGIG